MVRTLSCIAVTLLLLFSSGAWADFTDDFESYSAGSALPSPWSLSATNNMVVNSSGWQASKGISANSANWHGSTRPTGYDPCEVCYELSLKARISSANGLVRHTWKVGNGTANVFFEMDQNTLEIALPGGAVPFVEDVWYDISVVFCADGSSNWSWHGSYRAWTGLVWGAWTVMGTADIAAGFAPETVDLGGIYAFDIGDPDNSAMDDVSFVAVSEPVSCYVAIEAGFGLPADVNEDCYVGLDDFALIAQQWLECMQPGDPACD